MAVFQAAEFLTCHRKVLGRDSSPDEYRTVRYMIASLHIILKILPSDHTTLYK